MEDLTLIIQGCTKGDEQCQRKLFMIFGPKMLAVCRRYCNVLEDARDAMQDGFVKVFTQIHKFKGDSRFETWMTRVFINTAIDQFRKSTKYSPVEDPYQFFEEETDYAGFEHELEPEITAEQAYQALDKLPLGYRAVFSLYVIDGFSHREISNQLGISEGTSKSQLSRARAMLYKVLTGKGLLSHV